MSNNCDKCVVMCCSSGDDENIQVKSRRKRKVKKTKSVLVRLNPKKLKKALRYRNIELLRKLKRIGSAKTLSQANEQFLACKQFLIISAEAKEAAPNEIIDKVWHEFILRTIDYDKYCRQYLGVFIHHRPSDGKVDLGTMSAKFTSTLAVAKERFKSKLSRAWNFGDNRPRCEGGSSG